MKTSNVILGIIGAAATGAILGILFAPDKGAETRRKIAQKSKDYSDGFKDKLNSITNMVSSNGENLMEDVKSKFNLMGNEATSKA